MKKTYFLPVLILAGCLSKKPAVATTPAVSDVERGAAKFPGYTQSEYNDGKMFYEKHCNLCHGLKNPASYSETDWNKIVPDMCKKVNRKQNNALDEKAQQAILRYVITMGPAKKQ